MEPDAGNREKRTTVLFEVLAVMFGAVVFGSSFKIAVLQGLIDSGFTTANGNEQLVGALLQNTGFCIVVFWYLRAVREEQIVDWKVPRASDIGIIVLGSAVLFGSNYGLQMLFSTFDISVPSNPAVEAGAGNPEYLLMMVVVSMLVVGPVEEVLFRGVVQGRLREYWDAWPAIILATILFGLLHFFGISYIISAAVLGVLLGYLYERTGNIVVPAVIHGVNNAVIFARLYLGEIGVL